MRRVNRKKVRRAGKRSEAPTPRYLKRECDRRIPGALREENSVKTVKEPQNPRATKSPRRAERALVGSAAANGAGDERAKATESDGRVVLQVRIRQTLRREIKRLADDAGVTSQTFVLLALRDYGVGVIDEDLVDLRKGEYRALRSGSRPIGNFASQVGPLRALLDLAGASRGSAGSSVGVPIAGLGGGLTLIINNHAAKADP
jgi:hypothetical protein